MKKMFQGAPKPLKNVLRLYWPKFPGLAPREGRAFTPRNIPVKKWRRALYWSRQAERSKYTI
jgi:hypothetical protein